MKWFLILACVAILVPIAFVYTWQYGHPMNFPVTVQHDFSKLGYKSEHQVRLKCGWLIVCDSVPYDIKFVLPDESNPRFLAKIPKGPNRTEINFPGSYRIIVADDKTKQVLFNDVIVGVRASHLHVSFKSKEKKIEADTEPLKKLWVPAGLYSVSVENLELVNDFDNPNGLVVFKWSRK